ncbi:MAG: hypothetical protein MMC23_006618 [Stictis urceolatum]|nr:hypothetical protein [Stictis urceolata]
MARGLTLNFATALEIGCLPWDPSVYDETPTEVGPSNEVDRLKLKLVSQEEELRLLRASSRLSTPLKRHGNQGNSALEPIDLSSGQLNSEASSSARIKRERTVIKDEIEGTSRAPKRRRRGPIEVIELD